MSDISCGGCIALKYKRFRSHYCKKTGLNLPGNLERSEECKRQNLKEYPHETEAIS